MKAIIPVAGVGKRLKPHTHTLPKVLITVAGKPILGHILDELKKIKIKDLVLVIGHMGEKIKEYVDNNYNFKTTYIMQEERKGLGHAIYLTKEYFSSEPILIILGDTIFKADLEKVLSKNLSAIGVKAVENPHRFGVVKTDKKGNVLQLIEKSDKPPSNLAIVGIYYIKNSNLLGGCLKEIVDKDIKTAGEYQLTDALQLMVKRGEKIKTFEVSGWYDCGKPETLLDTNCALLQRNFFHRRYHFPNSVIQLPVAIGKKVIIENSVIGPYVSIADDCLIKNSIITNSIINEQTKVENVLLDKSIIGSNATIIGRFDKINLGDSSEIDLGGK